MKAVLDAIVFLWQAIQTLVGYIVLIFYKEENSLIYKGKTIRICPKFRGGISLGNVVIVRKYPYNTDTWNTVKHEWGHTVQSLYLGPLYIFIIGIPSLLWAWLHKSLAPDKSYYWFYTERWADKLGNVKREN